MNRDTLSGALHHAKGRAKTATGSVMGDVGRQIEGGYDQAAGAVQHAYGDARDAYEHALDAAEQNYNDARAAAEQAYEEAQARAEALISRGRRAYRKAAQQGQAYGQQAARYADDNKSLALLLAGGVGFLVALAFKRSPAR